MYAGPIRGVVHGIYDGPHATPPQADSGPVFLGIKNVTPDGRLDISEIKHIAEEHYLQWTRRVEPRTNHIVFSYEASLHRYAIIPEGFRGCLGRRLGLIRPNVDKVVPRFLHYYLLSTNWRSVVETHVVNGATVDRIPILRFPEFQIRIPDLHAQRSVVSILATYDDLIENNRRRIRLLEQKARLIYEEWFVRIRFPGHERVPIIDGVPRGWKRKRVIDVADVLSGGTPKTTESDYWGGDIPFFTSKDAVDDVYVFDTERTITPAGLKNCNSNSYPKETVFTAARGTVGKVNLAQMFSDHISTVLSQVDVVSHQTRTLVRARDLLLPRLMSGEFEP